MGYTHHIIIYDKKKIDNKSKKLFDEMGGGMVYEIFGKEVYVIYYGETNYYCRFDKTEFTLGELINDFNIKLTDEEIDKFCLYEINTEDKNKIIIDCEEYIKDCEISTWKIY